MRNIWDNNNNIGGLDDKYPELGTYVFVVLLAGSCELAVSLKGTYVYVT